MAAINECLGCGVEFDHADGECPSCGWNAESFAERGRYGLAKEGHGEPDDEEEGSRDGESSGPPPGPDGLIGL
ncbi:hypothetical protein Hbl1158_04885 [Halobaculum sp. CBA1158]|uniref:hypothetical protein n=1 Tax=Halobaculum sp. CBA1158 TaxID=2904243 RepID=UPI001F22849D|nr:hypothetical protein [Halobaculum sp. CBA1158]UIP00698.1 hypothetical protein Hbl1158_04885 [Halobaculum sp. CBA1158]